MAMILYRELTGRLFNDNSTKLHVSQSARVTLTSSNG